MPTPQAYNRLYAEHRALRRAVAKFLAAPEWDRKNYEAELWDLAGDYEPSEIEQGLIPIPEKYAEQ
jgi:hypothetical protein